MATSVPIDGSIKINVEVSTNHDFSAHQAFLDLVEANFSFPNATGNISPVDNVAYSYTYTVNDNSTDVVGDVVVAGLSDTDVSAEVTSISIVNSTQSSGIPVNTIAENAFYNNDVIESVTISNLVTTISDNAFFGCSNLVTVTIEGNNLQTIGNSAFKNCSNLTTVVLNEGLETIGNSCFSNCDNLTTITVPNSVITIGDNAFNGSDNLRSIEIDNVGSNLQHFGNNVVNGTNLSVDSFSELLLDLNRRLPTSPV